MKRQRQTSGSKRLRGLNGQVRDMLVELKRAHAAGRSSLARAHWLAANRLAAGHPELERWAAVLDLASGAPESAEAALRRALSGSPDDGELLCLLGQALAAQGKDGEAAQAMSQAFSGVDDAAGFLELGIACDRLSLHQLALDAADACLARSSNVSQAALLRARSLLVLGQSAEAASACRALIARRSKASARAWFLLLDMKTESVTGDELRQLEDQRQQAQNQDDRLLLAFALGQAYEQVEDYPRALRTLHEANALARIDRPWQGAEFTNRCRAIADAFCKLPNAAETEQGAEVIFLVGMPRSGSTLFEQVLSAHPEVEGASELNDLPRILQAESRRRGKPLEQWAPNASAEDWARLGQDYLEATARWRRSRSVSTDKLPSNWLLAGAAMAMLPGARFVECTRDAVDTCWSCYRQLFASGLADYAYDFADLAAYRRELDQLGQVWTDCRPQRYRSFSYEVLVGQPEDVVRELLSFCGLSFAQSCLQPHRSVRNVRTASAAQVRQPLAPRVSPREAYGDLLNPLRECLQEFGRAPRDSCTG